MAKQRINPVPANETAIPRKRSPIDLRIHSADILLSGRFHRWQATAFTGLDLDQVSVRMAVDSTSPDQLTGETPSEQDLFSFRSKAVERVNPALFRADGELNTETGVHPFEMQIELPEGHNAFFAISFVASKYVLGSGWAELVTGGSGSGGIDAERRLDPWAGVRDPELAAA